MNKSVAYCLASLILASPLGWAQAQVQQQAPVDNRQAEAPDTETTLNDLSNMNTPLGKTSAALENNLLSNWKANASRLTDKVKSMGQKELNKYRLAHTFGPENQILQANNLFSVDANYQIVVEPNYRDGEQVRRDIFVFGLGAAKGLSSLSSGNIGTAINGKFQVRVTFSRVFTGPNAKIDAIVALPYLPTKVPLTANGIKDKIKVGETIRVEVLGNMGIGAGTGKVQNLGTVGAGVGYGRDALFMLDIYRHSPRQTRVRMFGLKNRGTFNVSANATITPWNAWRPNGDGKIENAVKAKTNVGMSIGVSKSADIFHDFPIDTMMLDYLYTFNTETSGVVARDTAEAAVDEILLNARRLGFLPLFNLLSNEADLGQNIKKNAELSERLAKEDLSKGNQARVRHLFKGRITSNITTISAGIGASALIGSASTSMSVMRSFVRSEDTLNQKSYYMLVSASDNTQGRAFLGRKERITTNDVDVLMTANEQQKITAMSDIITSTEIRDKHLGGRELTEVRSSLKSSLPSSLLTPAILDFLPQTDQRDAYFRSRFAFGLEAFDALDKISQMQIAQALYKFLDNHPQKSEMHLPADMPNSGPSFTDYVMNLSSLIHQAVSKEFSYDQRLVAFNMLIRDPIFQRYLIGQFFTSLLPANEAQKMASIQMQFSSAETPSKDLSLGDNKVSDVYRFVSFMRSVLNDRSYDLRLDTQLNEDGTQILVTPAIKGFNVNPNQIANQAAQTK